MTDEIGTDLYRRTIAYDYGDAERNALMKKVWSVTPWMIDAWTGSGGKERDREMCEWCRERFGDEASPIHGRPGAWQRGSATIYGYTWFGFATEAQMREFEVAWTVQVGALS